MRRLDAEQHQTMNPARGEEIADGSGVGGPRVGVADGGGEELSEAIAGLLPGVGDDGGDDAPAAASRETSALME